MCYICCAGAGGQDGGDGGVVPDDFCCVTAACKPTSQPSVQWRLVKKRGVVPESLVQTRLNNFVRAFSNLRKSFRRMTKRGTYHPMGSKFFDKGRQQEKV